MIGVDKIGYTQEEEPWQEVNREHLEEHRGVRAHGEEVPEDGGPLPSRPEEAHRGERAAGALRGDDRTPGSRRLPQLEEAAARGHGSSSACATRRATAGATPPVQRYVKRRRERWRRRDQGTRRGTCSSAGFPECQVDFGGGGLQSEGVVTRGGTSRSASPLNVRLTQVFWGETSECVCRRGSATCSGVRGRRAPRGPSSDNATEVGRRVCGRSG